MKLSVGKLFFIFLLQAFTPKLIAQAPTSTDLFWLGDQAHSREEFIYAYNKNRHATKSDFTKTDLEEYFRLYVDFKLKVREAKTKGLHEKESFRKEMATYRKQLAKPYLAKNEVSDKLVAEAYQRMLEEVEASHILIELPAGATPSDTLNAWNTLLSIRDKAEKGQPFFELARQFSDDPSATQNAGYLGYFGAFQMVYPFENAAFSTPAGQVSLPFRTSFGYHIVYVHSRRKALGSYKLAHIFLRNDSGDSTLALKKANEILDRLNRGENWDELAARYSDESTNKNKGGELPWLTVRQLPGSFSEAVTSMTAPGQLSGPLKSGNGYHILKLLEHKPVPPLSEIREQIELRITRDERSQKLSKRTSEALIDKLGLRLEQKAVDSSMSIFDGRLLEGNWTYDISREFGEIPLLNSRDTVIRTEDFFRYVEINQRNRTDLSVAGYANNLWNEFLLTALEELELQRLAAENSEYRFLLNEYYEGTLLFEIMNEKVWQFANEDSVGLSAFFENNRTQYQWPERAKATVISGKTSLLDFISSASADSLYLLSKDSLTEKESLFKYLDNIQQTLDTQSVSADSLVFIITSNEQLSDKTAFEISQRLKVKWRHQIGPAQNYLLELCTASEKVLEKFCNADDPLSLKVTTGLFSRDENSIPTQYWRTGVFNETEGRFSTIYKIDEIQPSRPKELHEIRGRVVSDYQEFLEKEWLNELRKKYPLKVDEKAWKNVVKSLEQ